MLNKRRANLIVNRCFQLIEEETFFEEKNRIFKKNMAQWISTESDDIPNTLEDHIAQILCVGYQNPSLLNAAKEKAKHPSCRMSKAGSRMVFQYDGDQLCQVEIFTNQERRLAEATLDLESQEIEISIYYYRAVFTLMRQGIFKAFVTDDNTLLCKRSGLWHDQNYFGKTLHKRTYAQIEAPEAEPSDNECRGEQGDAFSLCFQALRTHLDGIKKPTRKAFLSICKELEQAALIDQQQTAEVLVPYLQTQLSSWPARIRMAPMLWINRLLMDALPLEALHLVSSLSLTAATLIDCKKSEHYPLLVQWLRDYPEDGPILDGISWSRREETIVALARDMKKEQDKRFFPTKEKGQWRKRIAAHDIERNGICFHQEEDQTGIFRSTLFQHVRVLDLSWDPNTKHGEHIDPWFLSGRGLGLVHILPHLGDTLEILDLCGQSVPETKTLPDTYSKQDKDKLQHLKECNISGGFPFTDNELCTFLEACPVLEAIHIAPGHAGEPERGEYGVEWILDEEAAKNTRLSAQKVTALSTHPQLNWAQVGYDEEKLLPAHIKGQSRSWYQPEDTIAHWSRFFEF